MNDKFKNLVKIMGIALSSTFLIGCGSSDTAETRVESAENLILQGNNVKGALNVLDEALKVYPDNSNIIKLKSEIEDYMEAKDLYYKNDFDGALECLNNIEDGVMEADAEELVERIDKQKEDNSKRSLSDKANYLRGSEKISQEEAAFPIEEAFDKFMPYEEKSPNEDEFNRLMTLSSRTPEEEQKLSEIKETILGAVTVSSNAYKDADGVFRVGCQHYLYSSTGKHIIYKLYKSGNVLKVGVM